MAANSSVGLHRTNELILPSFRPNSDTDLLEILPGNSEDVIHFTDPRKHVPKVRKCYFFFNVHRTDAIEAALPLTDLIYKACSCLPLLSQDTSGIQNQNHVINPFFRAQHAVLGTGIPSPTPSSSPGSVTELVCLRLCFFFVF